MESIGHRVLGIQASEYETWRTQKKSLHAAKDISKGEKITEANTISISPPDGLSPLLFAKHTLVANSKIFSGEAINKTNTLID